MNTETRNTGFALPALGWLVSMMVLCAALQVFAVVVLAHPEISTSEDDSTVIVNDAPDQDLLVFGRSVQVTKAAKGVLAVGGDVIVEGRVEGDVATIGGNIIQKEGAYIGGNVVAFGGTYRPEAQEPLRAAGTQTVMFDMFADELRNFGQHPTQILSPTWSLAFVAQRVVVALIWFVITLVFTTIAPGAVGRAVARLHLSWLKMGALGSGVLVAGFALVIASVAILPNYLWGTLVGMGSILLVLSFTFGKVALQVSTGKLLQKYILSERNRSETLAVLLGVASWTILLSLPYVWLIALFAVFTFGIGLIITGRTSPKWQTP
ncbi:MAG TPA: polymer-forming cytoskeletal protein [Pyrinomonadaceae bacterium]|nr:polymer-forming cytoskeletal protein [Pyrinomonadaceae bacterium]